MTGGEGKAMGWYMVNVYTGRYAVNVIGITILYTREAEEKHDHKLLFSSSSILDIGKVIEFNIEGSHFNHQPSNLKKGYPFCPSEDPRYIFICEASSILTF